MSKYIIKELLKLINEYDGRFTKQDYHILGQLYRVVNFCVDRNGCHHGDDGRFVEKNGTGGSLKLETVQSRSDIHKRLQPSSLNQIKGYLFPNGIGESVPEKKRACLLLAATGLCNEDIADCINHSRGYVKILLSYLAKDFGSRNRTDLVVKAIETGALRLDEIPTFKADNKIFLKKIDKYLSPREKECISYIATGCSNSEIAKMRNVDLGTVKAQAESAFLKYGVMDRTMAVVIALKKGDITLEDIKNKRKEFYYKI